MKRDASDKVRGDRRTVRAERISSFPGVQLGVFPGRSETFRERSAPGTSLRSQLVRCVCLLTSVRCCAIGEGRDHCRPRGMAAPHRLDRSRESSESHPALVAGKKSGANKESADDKTAFNASVPTGAGVAGIHPPDNTGVMKWASCLSSPVPGTMRLFRDKQSRGDFPRAKRAHLRGPSSGEHVRFEVRMRNLSPPRGRRAAKPFCSWFLRCTPVSVSFVEPFRVRLSVVPFVFAPPSAGRVFVRARRPEIRLRRPRLPTATTASAAEAPRRPATNPLTAVHLEYL